ncbi:MAG TPA: trypsin-like peptidase domain-containing protein [Verrucomicrobiae bacterium]|nr:trypsin-like peptidase domain-containing protein [Verrucomicrobiae bacterium]
MSRPPTLLKKIAAGSLAFALAVSLPAANAPVVTDIRRNATVEAVERVMPCVVNIATETIVEYQDFYQRLFSDFFGQQPGARTRQQHEYSVGSGVIIDPRGYVLTNLHVVRRANRTQVKLWDGREYEAIPIVATTHSDVALLKIQAKPGETFHAIHFAKDDDLLLGETVLALGNPFGLGGSVTKGILSSKSRRPDTGNEPLDVNNWLQTDAAINPGNSGGPLINLHGDLIGLNVAVYKEGQGIGFAIPVKQVSEALSSFFTPEVRQLLWVGARLKVGASPLTVGGVQPNSPAARAGLQKGDLIYQVNGQPVDSLISFDELIAQAPDHKIKLAIEQGQIRKTLSIQAIPFKDIIQQRTGLTLAELTSDQATHLGLEDEKGLLITNIQRSSPADKAGLQKGFIITAMDDQNIENLMNAGVMLTMHQKADSLKLAVIAPRRVGAGYLELQQGTVDLPLR